MALEEYRRKRDFDKTPEPSGAKPAGRAGRELRFVVQKHKAGRLHYDFRLELDGVLVSWAVPKGPSMKPGERRLAMKVEDHPLEYRTFEGIIAKGNYGAGTVIVWDEGVYHAVEAEGKEAGEKALRSGLKKGDLKFVLEGKRLKGEFALVRMKGSEEDAWLLLKKKDQYASQADILLQDTSVVSGRTLAETAADEEEKDENEDEGEDEGEPDRRRPPPAVSRFNLAGAPRGDIPEKIEPMLAQLADEPFSDAAWVYELKWDGFRGIARIEPGKGVRLLSRTQLDLEKEFGPVYRQLSQVDFPAVLDGEIVVLDDQGRSEFRLLQNYRKTGKGTLVYYVFDILFLEGHDLRGLPLVERKRILRQALPAMSLLKYSQHTEQHGVELYRLAVQNGLEGIVAKKADSPYRPGVRSGEWLKFKTHTRQDAVIGGFTEPKGARKYLGALLLGVYEQDELVYIGHAGGGFEQADLAEVYEQLKPLQRKTAPFTNPPARTNAPATWVKPELVCEVKFSGWTEFGMMRQPIYLGLRSDKDPRQVCRERPVQSAQKGTRPKMARKKEQKTNVEIDGHELALTNLDKLYWPDAGLTKGDLVDYYRAVAAVMLPYLKDRPQSLHRFPNGVGKKGFYQKDVNDAPEWVQTAAIEAESTGEMVDYLICQNEATLVYMGNLGCLEINPWNSRLGKLDYPDYLVMDLDPEDRPFEDVVKLALQIHAVFEQIEVQDFIKTSGQSGLHIFAPLGARYPFDQVRQFAEILSQVVHSQLPDMTSVVRSPSKRQGLIYLDYLQNRIGQTMAAPYSPRPKPGAPVSTPLEWKEVKPGLSPLDFTMKNIRQRLDRLGDLWQPLLGSPGMDMAKSLGLLEKAWKKTPPRKKRKV